MPRFRLELEFDGGGYVGWQRQANGPSIQARLEEAAREMLGEEVTAISAGRTDAGVHALAMTVHIDLLRHIEPERLGAGLNHFLANSRIAVLHATSVDEEFHARFSATSRRYRYVILNRRAPPALEAGRVWHVAKPLDEDAMHEAAQFWVGHHDFTSFRASECQAKTAMKTLDSIAVARSADKIHIETEARSFLHHQVRNFVGTLKLIGEGTRAVRFANDALKARNRSAAGPTAPPQGLYFICARYDTPPD